MRKRTKVMVAIVICAAAVAASALRIYFIREDSGGDVLWNANEAYLFIGVSRRGAHVSYLQYPWMIFKEYVGGVRLPDNERGSVTVIQVTPSGVEQHIVEVANTSPGSGPGEYTPFEGRIYANCPALGGLCRWAGDHFERATEDESTRLVSSSFPDSKGWSNRVFGLTSWPLDNLGGWSKRAIGAGPANTFARLTADVGGRFTLSEKSDPLDHTGYAAVSIYVQRPSQTPERIWYLDGHPRRVSKAEYELTFGRR
jgi:hypothetical protein